MKFAHTAGLLLVLAICGCTSSAEKTMGGGEPFFYPAMEQFDQEGLFSVDYPAAKGNWVEARKAAKADGFATAIANFEKAPLPSGFTDRQPKKDAAIAAAKAFHEKAKGSGTNEEVQAAHQALKDAMKALRGVNEPAK